MECIFCKKELQQWCAKYYRCSSCYRLFAVAGLKEEQIEGLSRMKEALPHEQ